MSQFVGQKEYGSIVDTMHLTDGTIFGLPIVFDTDREDIDVGDKLLLTYNGQNIGTLAVDEKWVPVKAKECQKCYGSTSIEHPAVQMVAMERGKYYLGGKVCLHAALCTASLGPQHAVQCYTSIACAPCFMRWCAQCCSPLVQLAHHKHPPTLGLRPCAVPRARACAHPRP